MGLITGGDVEMVGGAESQVLKRPFTPRTIFMMGLLAMAGDFFLIIDALEIIHSAWGCYLHVFVESQDHALL